MPYWPSLDVLTRRNSVFQEHPNTLLVICATLIGATWLTVGLRVWCRARLIHSFGWDDATICLANVFFTIFAIAAIIDVELVLNTDMTLAEPNTMADVVDWLIVAEVFYITTMMVFKISLGLFFLRIINTRWQRHVVYVAVVVSTVFSLIFLFFTIFECGIPTDRVEFAMRRLTLHCVDARVISFMGYFHAAVVSASDWAFTILLIPLLIESRMSTRDKVIVSFILTLGTIGSVCSLVRIKYINQFSSTWLNFFDFALWSVLEPGIGIVANCLATLRPLLRLAVHGSAQYTSHNGSRHMSREIDKANSSFGESGGYPARSSIRSDGAGPQQSWMQRETGVQPNQLGQLPEIERVEESGRRDDSVHDRAKPGKMR